MTQTPADQHGAAERAVTWEIPALQMSAEQLRFFGEATGIRDPEDLRRHIEQVQREALAIAPYRCICKWSFLDYRTATLPAYPEALKLGSREDALYIDCGCFCGTDIRKAIADGWPRDRILGTDIQAGYFDIGRKLFRESSSPAFIAGDLFSNDFLDPDAPIGPDHSLPPLSSLKTLTPLRGKATVINAGSLFHLFDEKTQQRLAPRLLSLLSKAPGSIIIGGQVGAKEGEEYTGKSYTRPNSNRYIYSPTKWIAMWRDIDASLDCSASLTAWPETDQQERFRLVWSVKRT